MRRLLRRIGDHFHGVFYNLNLITVFIVITLSVVGTVVLWAAFLQGVEQQRQNNFVENCVDDCFSRGYEESIEEQLCILGCHNLDEELLEEYYAN